MIDFQPGLHLPEEAERFPGAGGDVGYLRLATKGASALTIVEYTSEDQEWVPYHSHPWDELLYVLDGETERLIEVASRHGVVPVERTS